MTGDEAITLGFPIQKRISRSRVERLTAQRNLGIINIESIAVAAHGWRAN